MKMENKGPEEKLEEILKELDALKAELKAVKANIPKKIVAEKLAGLTSLITGLTHEFNNPLTTIMGYSQLMLENPDIPQDKIKESARLIYESSKKCASLINLLTSFANVKMSWRPEYIDLNEVLEIEVSLMERKYQKQGLTIEKVYGEIPKTEGDRQSLGQAVTNILQNGLEHMSEVGIMQVRSYQEGNKIYVTFSDTGKGFDNEKDEHLKVFDPFYTTKEVGQGPGLGLSVAYGVMKLHKGSILACNYNDGSRKGARIILEFPIQEKQEAPEGSESFA